MDKTNENTAAEAQQKAAADLARQKVLESFKSAPENYTPIATGEETPEGTSKERVIAPVVNAQTLKKDKLEKYHKAWQEYYQKYYTGYYQEALKKIEDKATKEAVAHVGTGTKDYNAVAAVKERLRMTTGERFKKVRRSKHFWPIALTAGVVLVILFLQYNRILIGNVQAFVMPRNEVTKITEVDPLDTVAVSMDPKILIPKINVSAPLIFGSAPDVDSMNVALRDGVAQFHINGANARPGEVGNMVFSGHSSGDVFDSGDFKFIFAQLDRLVANDLIYINYQGIRYTYRITDKVQVDPTNISVLTRSRSVPTLILITCYPVGSVRYRLLVFAEQISPVPSAYEEPTQDVEPDEGLKMPSNTLTFFERIADFFIGLFGR